MKTKLLLLLLIPAALFSQAPPFAWVKASASQVDPQVSGVGAIVADTINHFVYGTGSFSGGSINFGSGDLDASAGSACVYLVKRDVQGNLIWAKVFSSGNDNIATGIGVDNAGNVYITGYSQNDTVRFGSQYVLNSHSGSTDHTVLYVAKFDANGNTTWLKGSTGGGGIVSNAMAVDGAGNCYVTGLVVDSTSTFLSSGTLLDGAFFMKVNASGSLVWFAQPTPSQLLVSQGTSVAIDKAGNIVFAGTYTHDLMFGNIPVTYASGNGTWDRFTAKLSASTGSYIWAVGAGVWQSADYNYGVATDSQNNVYLTGYLTTPTQGAGSNAFIRNYFLEKLNSAGVSQWIKTYPISLLSSVSSVAVDKHNNVFAAYSISDTTVYGNFTISPTSFFANLSTQIAIEKLDASGTVLYAKSHTDQTGSFALCNSIAVDESGYMYLNGSINGTGTFDSDNFNTGSNSESVFARLGGSAVITGIANVAQPEGVSFYPNPASASVYIKGLKAKTSFKVNDLSGKTVLEGSMAPRDNKINVTTLQNGIYILEVVSESAKAHLKIIVENN